MATARLTGTDDDLTRALADVNLPNLLLVLHQLTGDEQWLSERYAPEPIVTPEGSLFPDDSGGYSDEQAEEIRSAAFGILKAFRDSGSEPPAPPDTETLRQLMEYSVGEPVTERFASMLMEEIGFIDRDDQWRDNVASAVEDGAAEDFSVIVVGAGMSGLCQGVKLKDAGIDFTIIEKNDAVGGTWYENSYPDCGVDTPNHFYSYSFERNPNWSGYFSKRDELYEYFETCADKFGLRKHIRLNTEVTAMRYNADTNTWRVDVTGADGDETLEANVVVTAVGQLNRPNIPDIDGINDYTGTLFHSARWDHSAELEGQRVAVIGTGCSAVQLLPKTADRAQHTSVFQRSPHWVSPSRDYYRPVEDGLIWALNHIPYYAEWHRARMIFGFADRNWPAVPADPEWPHPERATNEVNDAMREALTEYIREQLGPKSNEYMDACVPDFPVFGKRLIIDNGWYETLARDDVSLVTSHIRRITETGIETEDGTQHEFDAIILGTGFVTNVFLWPMSIEGRSGTSLEDVWGDYPRAYRGITVPDYPNLFCLYGPNTNIVHGGSIIYQVECQVHYVMQALGAMLGANAAAMEVKSPVNDEYNKEVQAISEKLAWGHAGVAHSWYKNSTGKVVQNSPFSLEEYWARTHDLDTADYEMG